MADGEERAVAPVIGFILIFAIVSISWTVYQGVSVPQQEKQTEFDHNQQIQDQLIEVRDTIVRVSVTGASESVSVKLGATYPRRVLAVTLANSAGALQTRSIGRGVVNVRNATATNAETADYWNWENRTFRSKSLQYVPVYTRYTSAPDTIYGNTVVYNDFGNDRNLTVADQSVVDGRKITLIALTGNLTEAKQGSASVNIDAKSASSNRITVKNDSYPINITLPTRLSEEEWKETLEEEICPPSSCPDDGRYVRDVSVSNNNVTISLVEGVTYDLRMAKVAVGTGATDEDAEYLTAVRKPDGTVFNDTSHRIVVEVRDRFNNPVSGFDVNASATGGSFESTQVTTGSDGQAEFNWTAPGSDSTGSKTLTIDITDSPGAKETVDFSVDVKELSGGSDSDSGNDSGTDDINPKEIDLVSTSQNGNSVTITLDNTKASTVTLTKFRVSFFFQKNGDTPVKEVDNSASGSSETTYHSNDETVPMDLISFDTNDIDLSPGNNEIRFIFDNINPGNKGFFVVTFEDTDGNRFTYFVGFG